jgi:hypothetical protein
MLRSNLHIGFSSGVFDSALLLQRGVSAGQPVSGHTDSSQATLFQEINLVG